MPQFSIMQRIQSLNSYTKSHWIPWTLQMIHRKSQFFCARWSSPILNTHNEATPQSPNHWLHCPCCQHFCSPRHLPLWTTLATSSLQPHHAQYCPIVLSSDFQYAKRSREAKKHKQEEKMMVAVMLHKEKKPPRGERQKKNQTQHSFWCQPRRLGW